MRSIHAMFVVALGVLTACVGPRRPSLVAPVETVLARERVELPTFFFSGRPYVELKVNGRGPYRFLVDTGSECTVILPRVMSEAGIRSSGFMSQINGSGGTETVPIVIIDRIEADSFSLRAVCACVESPETSRLLERSVDRDFGGILGMNAFQKVLLEIDYPLQKASVARIGSSKLVAADGLAFTGIAPYVPIVTPSKSHPAITALVDTGSDENFAFSDIAAYPTRVGLVKRDGFSSGIGGAFRERFGQLAGDIRLGPATWRDPKIHEGDIDRIGSSALQPWKLVIDPVAKKLWLLEGYKTSVTEWTGPLDSDGRPAVYGFGWAPVGKAFVVTEVDPGSRAERAGLKVGDHLMGDRPEVLPASATSGDAPATIRFTVLRGTEEIVVAMTLIGPR